jgi:molecular chaperone DnaJ
MAKDYYKILDIKKGSTKAEIKKAYKKLAKKYHPDLNKEANAAEKFKEINEAAAILGDDKKRQHYDQYGTADFGQGQGFSGFDFRDFSGAGFDFDDIFDSFFGGGRRRRGPRRGADLEYELQITLEDAAAGLKKQINIPRAEQCTECNGSGAKSEKDIITCETCHGRGNVTRRQRTPFGIFQSTGQCPHCHGQGKEIKEECPTCDGSGKVQKERKISIDIPAGVATGSRLRVAAGGQAGDQGAPAGDLYIYISVAEHNIFQREGLDIYTEVPISFRDVCLGGSIDVPTLKGKATLKVSSGTKANTIFRLKGKGIPSLRGFGTGDQLVKVIIDVPKKLSKKQKDFLEEFDKDIKVKRSVFDKIKDAF